MTTDNKMKYKSGTVVGVMVLLLSAMIAFHQFKIPTIMGQISEDLQMDAGTASWTMSVFTLIGFFLAIPCSSIVSKLGGRRVLYMSAIWMIVGSILGGFAGSAAMLLVSRSIEGVGFLFVGLGAPGAIRECCAPEQIGTAMGFFGAYVALGQIVAFNLTPVLYGLFGWKNVWFTYAALTLVFLVITIGVLGSGKKTDVPAEVQETAAQPTKKIGIMEVVKNKNLICSSLVFAVWQIYIMAIMTYFPQFATDNGMMTGPQASFAASIPMIMCIVFSPILGRLAEKVGRRKIFLLCIISVGICTMLIYQGTAVAAYIGFIVMGACGMGTAGIMFAAIGNIVGDDLAAQGMGVCITFEKFGQFMGTAIFLPILQMTGNSYFITACIIGLGGIVIAIIGMINSPKFV